MRPLPQALALPLHARKPLLSRRVRARGAALAAVCVWAWQPALADEVQEQLQRMNQRISQLEQQLEATQDELAAARSQVASQQQVIERADLDAEDANLSGMARWVRETQFDGWVASSYWYNANRPEDASGRDANRGNLELGSEADGLAYPFHPDHNSFQVDQVWFKLANTARADSRAGFGVDIVFGQTADALRAAGDANGDLSALYQAYAQYLAPVGAGILVTAGRFATPIGVETPEAVRNFNVTTGLLKLQLEPVNHVGVTLKSWIGPVGAMIGISNDAALNLNRDLDDGKTVLWGFDMDVSDRLAVAVNGLWGDSGVLPIRGLPPADVDPNTDQIGIVNLVVRWDPSDLLSTWLDFDYVWARGLEAVVDGVQQRVRGEPVAYGVAAASRYAISPQTGFGFRAELIFGRDNFLDPTLLTGTGDHTLWSFTGTLDHTFAQNFAVRVEGRYDAGETGGSDAVFYRDRDRDDFRRDQFVAGLQAYYRF